MTTGTLGSVAPLGRSQEPEGEHPQGTLIIIGGGEAKSGTAAILAEVVQRVGEGRLLISAVASRHQEELFEIYRDAFAALGLDDVAALDIRDRGDTAREENVRAFDDAAGIFFTGGDQLRITSYIADSPVHRRIRELYRRGGVIAGTSAGASALGDTMMVSGPSDRSHRLGDLLRMAPGLDLIPGLIIDQHFAERGRMGRLLGAVAQNPGSLAVGIDEDTAIVVEEGENFHVIGAGTVYVVDGEAMTHTNITEGAEDIALSAYDLSLHLLSAGDRYDMTERRPAPVQDVEPPPPEAIRQERRERRLADRRSGTDRRKGGRRTTDDDRDAGERAGEERRKGDRRGDDRRESERASGGQDEKEREVADRGEGGADRTVDELADEERRGRDRRHEDRSSKRDERSARRGRSRSERDDRP